MGRPLSRDWIRRRRHSEDAAQPRAPEGCDIRGVFWGRMDALNAEKAAPIWKTREVDRRGQDFIACRPFPLANRRCPKVLASRKAMGKK
jgi:hypothetical protein